MAYDLRVDEFTLYGDNNTALHYETDCDLPVHCKAATGGGDKGALLLIELGIDGNPCHRARVDVGFCSGADEEGGYDHQRDPVRVLSDAIETLDALRDQLAAMSRNA